MINIKIQSILKNLKGRQYICHAPGTMKSLLERERAGIAPYLGGDQSVIARKLSMLRCIQKKGETLPGIKD